MRSIQRESLCGRPRKGGSDSDIAKPRSADTVIFRINCDVGATVQGTLEGTCIHSCRTDARVWRKNGPDKRSVGCPRSNGHISRVEQPGAAQALRRAGIDVDARHVQVVAGGFDQAAVAALCTAARCNAAICTRRVIGPQHDLAAVTTGDGVSIDAGGGAHIGRGGVRYRRVLALVVATNQHGAATRVARGIDLAIE